MKSKKARLSFFIMTVLVIGYFFGPRPHKPLLDAHLPIKKEAPASLEKEILSQEAHIKNLKPDNQSRIIWYDSIQKNQTPYCIVYLHGFSASPMEGEPVHRYIAHKFGCNLYIPRLYGHGLNVKEPLLDLTEENYLASAKEAVAEAKCLGKKLIIMGTSTGCTFALFLASENPDIAGLLLYSPNIDLFDSKSFVLTQPWGLQLARWIVGGKYYSIHGPVEIEKYWYTSYRIEALVHLKNLLHYTMKKEVFQHIKQPVLMCYYYKNQREQDSVVSVPAMLKMFDELGTPSSRKIKVAIPNAGTHAIASEIWSHDISKVEQETSTFMKNILNIMPVN